MAIYARQFVVLASNLFQRQLRPNVPFCWPNLNLQDLTIDDRYDSVEKQDCL